MVHGTCQYVATLFEGAEMKWSPFHLGKTEPGNSSFHEGSKRWRSPKRKLSSNREGECYFLSSTKWSEDAMVHPANSSRTSTLRKIYFYSENTGVRVTRSGGADPYVKFRVSIFPAYVICTPIIYVRLIITTLAIIICCCSSRRVMGEFLNETSKWHLCVKERACENKNGRGECT